MPAGSVVIWAGGVWHGGGAFSDRPPPGGRLPDRAAVLFNMCRGQLRTQENSMIQLPHSTVARMPVDVQVRAGQTSETRTLVSFRSALRHSHCGLWDVM